MALTAQHVEGLAPHFQAVCWSNVVESPAVLTQFHSSNADVKTFMLSNPFLSLLDEVW